MTRQEEVTATELRAAGSRCAWRDCAATFEGMMPPGWVWLLTYWAPEPAAAMTLAQIGLSPVCQRDAALCPEHARWHAVPLEFALAEFARLDAEAAR